MTTTDERLARELAEIGLEDDLMDQAMEMTLAAMDEIGCS